MIENKLKQLEIKIEKAKNHSLEKKTLKNESKINFSDIKVALNCMLELVCGFIAGGSIGFGIDKILGTHFIFFIIFVILGFIAGLKNLSKYWGNL